MAGQLGQAAFWGLTTLNGTLPQSATNGASTLGSLEFGPLPHYLPSTVIFPYGLQKPADVENRRLLRGAI